ncbi:MAG: hypothetical protein CME36_02775 [unclassified Hahellaceae]|nr:hypothetical protein [Hahellaceae bacterium]|tara:strand:- start:20024 stop:20632 length:609 start_codon:yes stop_codon:yes gene_type:complete
MTTPTSKTIAQRADGLPKEAISVLAFWFDELTEKDWFKKSKQLDDNIRKRFGALHEQARRCECWHWREAGNAELNALGRLAEIILLDQFARNLYRDSPHAFDADPLALALAQQAVQQQADQQLEPQLRSFLYMPYMHSESAVIHEEAMRLFAQPGLEYNFKFEQRHKDIIDRFGRYPHRNEVLERESTAEEQAFLETPGSSF